MTGVSHIESLLLMASAARDLDRATMLVQNLTWTERCMINSFVYGTVLNAMARAVNVADFKKAESIRIFMYEVGCRLSPEAIGQALKTLALSRNFAAVDAITDHLTPSQTEALPLHDVATVLLEAFNDGTPEISYPSSREAGRASFI